MVDVVFDIGRVLVALQPERLLQLLRAHGGVVSTLEDVTGRIDLAGHETGRLHGMQLLQQIAALAPEPISMTALQEAWVDMLRPEPAMLQLADRLRQRHRIFLLTNVGDLHWAHLEQVVGLHRYALDVLRSDLAGVMKPDPRIYVEAERRFSLSPDTTVFIDDRAENIETARARGWRAFVHHNPVATIATLQSWGLDSE
jgi:HAD superfamily hydrolase (TIGR01509 family)